MIEKLQPFLIWIGDHWVTVSLVVSEIAALLPTKVNGILQGILKLGNAFFKKSSKKS